MPKANRKLSFKGKGPAEPKSSDKPSDAPKVDAYVSSLSRRQRSNMTPSKMTHMLDLMGGDDSDYSGCDISINDDSDRDRDYNPGTELELTAPSALSGDGGDSTDDALPDIDVHVPRTPRVRAQGRVRTRAATRARARAATRRGARARAARAATRTRAAAGRSSTHTADIDSEDDFGDVDSENDGLGFEDDEGWSTNPDPPNILPFSGTAGMIGPIPTTPLGFIQLFITRTLLLYVTEETNSYARYCREDLKQKTAYRWTCCNLSDIANYIGLRIFMGICKLPVEQMYWRASSIYVPGVAPLTMTFNRFKQISKYLHFHNRKAIPKGNTDRVIHIRSIMNNLQEKCKSMYMPKKNLSLDEGTLPYKGRLSMKIYNPAKPDKYGLKFYILCEAESGYVLDFSLYSGISQTLREIVFSLTHRYFGMGYHLYMDNYYNSVKLTQELYENGMHSSGTLRLSRGAPRVLKVLAANKKIPRDTMKFRRKENTFVICWQDVRLVTLITNCASLDRAAFVHHKRIRKDGRSTVQITNLERPIAIREYVKYMRGVDRFDQMIKYYSFTRRSMKWTKKVFMYFLQVMLHNAHVLYKKYGPEEPNKKMTLLQFHEFAYDALLNFNEDDWPAAEEVILSAADLPPEERLDAPHLPSDDAHTPSPPSGTPSPSAGSPIAHAARPAMPASPVAPSDVEDNPEAPEAEPFPLAKRPRIYDPPQRLQRRSGSAPHTITEIVTGAAVPRKRCRVCYRKKIRRETRYECVSCKVPLCVKGNCFMVYHSKKRYWVPESPAAASDSSAAPEGDNLQQ